MVNVGLDEVMEEEVVVHCGGDWYTTIEVWEEATLDCGTRREITRIAGLQDLEWRPKVIIDEPDFKCWHAQDGLNAELLAILGQCGWLSCLLWGIMDVVINASVVEPVTKFQGVQGQHPTPACCDTVDGSQLPEFGILIAKL